MPMDKKGMGDENRFIWKISLSPNKKTRADATPDTPASMHSPWVSRTLMRC